MKKIGFYALLVLQLIPILILVGILSSYSGIDGLLRFYGALCLIFLGLSALVAGLYFDLRNVLIGRIITGILAGLILFVGGYYAIVAMRVNSALGNMTAGQTSVQHFSLVVMSDFNENSQSNNIGILNLANEETTTAIDNFIQMQGYVDVENAKVYGYPVGMIRAMYAGEVDAIVINSNFVQMFEELDGLENIATDTKVLSTFEVETALNLTPMDVGEPFSVLFLGTDSMHEGDTSGLMDSIILVTFNLDELSFTMTSIPRDSYVQIPCFNNAQDKLSHVAACGSSDAVAAVEQMFDMDISHYVNINFRGFMEIVDALDGITVDVPFSFWEQDSRRRSGEAHRIHVEEGEQRLDGEQALALARHRRTLLNGDFARNANQQIVMEGIIREIFTEVDTVAEFLPLLEAIGNNINTNFSIGDLTALAQYTFEMLPTFRGVDLMDELHLISMLLSGSSGMVQSLNSPMLMDVVIPFEGAIRDARDLMMVNLGLQDPDFKFTFSFNGFAPRRRKWVDQIYHGEGELPQGINAGPEIFVPYDFNWAPEPNWIPPESNWTPAPEWEPGLEVEPPAQTPIEPGPDLLPEPPADVPNEPPPVDIPAPPPSSNEGEAEPEV